VQSQFYERFFKYLGKNCFIWLIDCNFAVFFVLKKSESGCEWLIRVFTDKQIVNEIICCPSERVRDYVAALIEQAVKCTGHLLSAKDCIIERN